VAADGRHIYAVGNSEIAKYDRRTGRRLAVWRGDPARFPHLNSCSLVGVRLVCAASNYPATPMRSRVEIFDPRTMRHLQTVDLGWQGGSLTWVDARGGDWWAGFANYDGRGGEAGRDHAQTKVVRFDRAWRVKQSWTLPPSVLERMKPYSTSGGVWGRGGALYVTGHDRPEAYVLRPPPDGAVLEHVATVPTPMDGQAIARWGGVLFGVRRATREIVAFRDPRSLNGAGQARPRRSPSPSLPACAGGRARP
jgi:hypothetical protein